MRITILTIFLSFIITLPAVGGERAVRHITADDGLSSNAIYSITQDSLGRMWFGTNDGLHSYDGNEVRVWRDPDMESLGQVVYAIWEDPDNRLWIGTESGLTLLDLRKERFLQPPFEKNGFRILSPVTSVLTDGNGFVWIATNGQGIIRYNPADNSTRHYGAGGKMNSDRISALLKDKKGTIWAASFDKGISRLDQHNDIFIPIAGSPEAALSLLEDSYGHFWTGTEKGLYRLDRENGTWSHILLSHSSNVFQIRRIVEYSPGTLLLASDEGLTVYDVRSGTSTNYTGTSAGGSGLNDRHLHSLFLDKDHGLWIGSYFGGVNYVAARPQPFRSYSRENSGLKGRIVSVFADAGHGKVWIGSDDSGVVLWDRGDGSFKTLAEVAGVTSSYHNIHSLLQWGDTLFTGMYMGGLDIIDLRTGALRNHKADSRPESLYSSSVYCLYRDRRGNIWVGTTRGLNRYIPTDDCFERIFDLNHAGVEHMFEDAHGLLYACSPTDGLFRLDPGSGKWKHLSHDKDKGGASANLVPDKVVTGAEDSLGRIWIGTDGNGLFRFHPESEVFERQSLPEEIRVISRIIPSGDRLWLATSHGLYCYTPTDGHLLSFSKADGLRNNQFMPNSGIILPDNTVLIGGVEGFNEFNPEDFTMEPVNPKVIISGMTLFNRPVAVDDPESPLKEATAYSDGLVLKHHHSIFCLSVAVLGYGNASGNRFMYKLEGFDPDWNIGPADGKVSYTNLPAGNYRFKVRGADGIGGWNEDSLSFPVKVLPPWWWSSPMIILYTLTFLLILYLLYRRILRKQEERLQLMTARKDKELYQSKIDFFTHMVHEIRTPLTLILTPLENVMKSKGTLEEHLPTLDVMHRNGHRLLKLVNRLMDFRKIEAGCMRLDLKAVDLTAMVREIEQNFLPGATAKGVTVRSSLPTSPVIVNADVEALHHVIDNLLSNALKFTSTEIWIEIEAEKRNVRLTVKDNGRGIPEEEIGKIFSPFYQIEATRPQDEIGTGIGLLLVKKYVDLMHGHIAVESRDGMGAAFSIWLEETVRAEATVMVSNNHPETPEENTSSESGDGKERILIVEDNRDLLDFLTQLFGKEYEVWRASDGEKALDVLKDHAVSIVVSDVMMPRMDGMELCRRIKSDISTSHIPVVLLTAKVETRDFMEGFREGADLYVSKPFSAELLKAQVAGILANRERLRQIFGSQPQAKAEGLVPGSPIDNEWLERIKEIVMRNLENPEFSVDILAKEIGISRTGLFSKLKAVAGMTPNAYIKVLRLKEAARLLSEEGCRVSEACYRVGFASRSHFARYFQEQFGVSPTDYRG